MKALGAAVALALALAACAPKLLQSVCFVPQPGVTVCQFAYEGDAEE